jgi:ankyrin repeat protein
MTDPELRKVAIELAELALSRGIDVNIPVEPNGRTFLHGCVLLRDSKIAVEAVGWLLAHGADPNRTADEGETPLSLSMRLGREELSELMRSHGGKL